MDVELTGHEILRIAERIERNGARFYRKAAVICDDPEVGRLFAKLAQWEARHIEVFRQMKQERAEQNRELGRRAPDRLNGVDAEAMAGLAVFAIRAEPADELSGHERRDEILRMAIEKEKDSIVYYTGLKDFVPRAGDKDVIAEIIQEEMKHVRILMQSLEQPA
ncbi:MAG: ferritin family protein [Sedimentisphaerales bacterium]|nr:ferritin family protein [Sedimentisphaerales bacterium]